MEHERNNFLQEAMDEKTSPERLKQLLYLNHPQIEPLIAKNSNTPPELLQQLAEHSDTRIRKHIAMNPSTPTETLLFLAAKFPKTVRTYASTLYIAY